VEVLPDLVSILADTAETKQEIDANEAGAAKARAEELLKSKEPETDYAAAALMLQEAEARLAVAQG
jgi:F-type H+-transporting ATPase subunit epsilon